MSQFMVIARHYPDLEPDYDGPGLSLEEQCEGVTREFPVVYGSRKEAQDKLDQIVRNPGMRQGWCSPDDGLEILECHW